MDFDETRLYYSHQQLQSTSGDVGRAETQEDNDSIPALVAVSIDEDDSRVDLQKCRRQFREFLRTFSLLLLWTVLVLLNKAYRN
jgi:uncharacterized protein YgfB (UPF0149 family)